VKAPGADPAQPDPLRPIDAHVHVVGNGAGGTGCWLRVTGWHRLMAVMMVRHLGLPSDCLRGDLDRLFVERLLDWVRSSSLRAAVILAHDEVRNDRGEILEGVGSFYVPNDYVLQLAAQHAEFLPGVSIHPARPDALEELERCVQAGAVLMKCLPNCHNIDCADRRYTRFWERMAQAGLPLLAHTGGEHTVPVIQRDFADPRILRRPLECGVTVIAAHCGTKSGLFDPEYFDVFAAMTREYPTLYGDISAFNVPVRGRQIRRCLESPLVERMIHGSDYPVPVHGHFAWLRGFISWDAFRQWERCPNLLERDYQLKRAMGFPQEVFSRVGHLLRLDKKNRAA
jgi:uncharacterized protein